LPKGLKPSLGVGLKGLGPSPGIDFKGIESSRGSSVLRTFLVGETSLVGALSSAGVLGMALLSILGSYEWVRKDTLTEVKSGYLGSSPSAVCELMEGRLGSDDQGHFEVGVSPQTTPIVGSGTLGCPSETGALTTRVVKKVRATLGGMGATEEAGDSLCVKILAKLSTSLP
jgi:hypothetical protein